MPTLWFQPCLLPPLPKPWQQRVPDAVMSVWLWAKTQEGLCVELELELHWLCPEQEPDSKLVEGTDSKYFH